MGHLVSGTFTLLRDGAGTGPPQSIRYFEKSFWRKKPTVIYLSSFNINPIAQLFLIYEVPSPIISSYHWEIKTSHGIFTGFSNVLHGISWIKIPQVFHGFDTMKNPWNKH